MTQPILQSARPALTLVRTIDRSEDGKRIVHKFTACGTGEEGPWVVEVQTAGAYDFSSIEKKFARVGVGITPQQFTRSAGRKLRLVGYRPIS